ncbi:9788_t:CDS:2 [Gigaspora margarita]|uniref:9788_t:CDS:1 n=1 Tax=Gigaspora margarita TaxID=4874 RepID=A0ABN7V475_GIGMA|nr:9788_t:CDS:2 [Gigaspora margarita]
MATKTASVVVPSESCVVSTVGQRRKSVRFSRFEKVYYTHSPIDYDRTSILAELAQQRQNEQCQQCHQIAHSDQAHIVFPQHPILK